MHPPTKKKRFPAWLRGLGWLAFGILAVATLLITARWLVMSSGHQSAKRIVSAQRKKPVAQRRVAPLPAEVAAEKIPGIPLSSVPHFGDLLVGDKETWQEFTKKLEEIAEFLRYKRTHPEYVDGVCNFRAVLQNMGVEVPETMTDAEAAAEYLKQADRFSTLLAQWQEAVAKGPLERVTDAKSNPDLWRIGWMSYTFARLMGMTGEAHLQAGDTEAAWADCQTLKNSEDRVNELYPLDSYSANGGMNYQFFTLAKSGTQSGAWTDEQLAEFSSVVGQQSALQSALQNVELQKKSVKDYYLNFHEHEEQFSKDFLQTPSQFNQFVNQIKLKLITEQQIQDNLEVELFEMDQQLSCFDPETGYYVRPTDEELSNSGTDKKSSGTFDSFYFMIKDLNGGGGSDDPRVAGFVIQKQSGYDQFRLAAALETYQRTTGKYPDHLDAISGQFPGGAPLDIATGQPYFYQPDADGGFTLWGTGIDGKSDGGNEKTDVVWKHRPSKPK